MGVRIDWSRLLGDIAWQLGEADPARSGQRVPCSTYRLSDDLDVPRGTLRGWMDGSEPGHSDGERLLLRWGELTGKSRIFAPTEVRSLSASAR